MREADRALLARVEARIRRLEPGIAAGLLASLRRVRELLDERALRDLLGGRTPLSVLLSDVALARAFLPFRNAIRESVLDGARLAIPDLPMQATKATVSALFGTLNDNVIVSVRSLHTAAFESLRENIRDVVQAHVENGLRDGVGPREIGRRMRAAVGLSATQDGYVTNLERELRNLSKGALDRKLRDKRFDGTIRRAIATGKPLTEKQIANITAAYRRKFLAHTTSELAATTARDAYREAQDLAWRASIDAGYIDRGSLYKEWRHSGLAKVPRPAHLALHGTVVPFDSVFPNGDRIPGEFDSYGCRCVARYFTRRARNVVRLAA
jgi:hypothetical protein